MGKLISICVRSPLFQLTNWTIFSPHKGDFLKRTSKKVIILWAMVILWMTIIFWFSNQPVHQSDELSRGITRVIVEVIEKVATDDDFDISSFNHIVRKNAHFLIYLILGVLVSSALKSSGVIGIRNVLISILICILYAMSDEYHQLFVPGRGGQIKDVMIDSAGAIVGVSVRRISWKVGK